MIAAAVLKLVTIFGAAGTTCAKGSFFGLKPWYHYLQVNDKCEIVNFKLLGSDSSFMLILLAVVDDLLRIAGLVAVGFIIYGGYKYLTSQGSPDATATAQKTIISALVGLVIAMLAVVLVSFLGNSLTK